MSRTTKHREHPSGFADTSNAERHVLGPLCLGRDFAPELASRIDPAVFSDPLRSDLVAHARELVASNELIDQSTITAHLEQDEAVLAQKEIELLEESGRLVCNLDRALEWYEVLVQESSGRVLYDTCDKLQKVITNGNNLALRAALISRIKLLGSPIAESGCLRELDVATLIRDGVPEVKFDLDEFLVPRTLTYLTGAPKGKKTLLALAWSIALTTRKSFCGLQTNGEHRILFLEAESATQIPSRFAKLCLAYEIEPDSVLQRIRFVTPRRRLRLEDAAQAAELHRLAADFKATWVVIDSFVRVHGLDENLPRDMALLANTAFLPLRDEVGCGVLILDHPPKSFGGVTRAKNESIRGSWEKLAAADSQIHVDNIATDVGKVAAVSVAASRLVPERDEPLYLRLWDTPNGGLAFEQVDEPQVPAKGRKPTAIDQAYNVISNESSRQPGLTFANAIRCCQAVGISKGTAKRAWAKLRDESQVSEVSEGVLRPETVAEERGLRSLTPPLGGET